MNRHRFSEIRALVARDRAYALPMLDAIRDKAEQDGLYEKTEQDEVYRAALADWLVNGGTVTLRDTLAAPFKDASFVQALATRFRYPFDECWTSIDTAMAKHRLPYTHIWVVKGRVTDDEAHGYKAKLGDIEWQFSDGPPGERSSSADYISLEEGIRAQAPAVFHFVDDEPETLWCESCGEAPVTQRLEFAGLCDGCAQDAEKEERALEAQGPEGNDHDLPTRRACGHPGSDDHEDCPNCAEVPA